MSSTIIPSRIMFDAIKLPSGNLLRIPHKITGPKIPPQFLISQVSLEGKLRVCLFEGSFTSTGDIYPVFIYVASLLKFSRVVKKKHTPTSWTVKCCYFIQQSYKIRVTCVTSRAWATRYMMHFPLQIMHFTISKMSTIVFQPHV